MPFSQTMPIVSPIRDNPLLDGRQSERALLVRRGIQLMFLDLSAAIIPELVLSGGRRADIAALTGNGEFWIVEIKTSVEDLRCDSKWPDYREHCDRLFFATHGGVPAEIFPADCGFILADGYGAEILRNAPEHRLAGATRRAMLMRFARAGAGRLMRAELAGIATETDE